MECPGCDQIIPGSGLNKAYCPGDEVFFCEDCAPYRSGRANFSSGECVGCGRSLSRLTLWLMLYGSFLTFFAVLAAVGAWERGQPQALVGLAVILLLPISGVVLLTRRRRSHLERSAPFRAKYRRPFVTQSPLPSRDVVLPNPTPTNDSGGFDFTPLLATARMSAGVKRLHIDADGPSCTMTDGRTVRLPWATPGSVVIVRDHAGHWGWDAGVPFWLLSRNPSLRSSPISEEAVRTLVRRGVQNGLTVDRRIKRSGGTIGVFAYETWFHHGLVRAGAQALEDGNYPPVKPRTS